MANSKSMIRDLTEGNVTKQLLRFAYPFMLANLLQTIYNIVDMIVIGQFVGRTALAAVSCGGDLSSMFLYVAVGFTGASQVLIGQYVGAGDREGVRKSVGTTFTFCFILGVAVTIFCIFASPALLHLINTPPEAFEQARVYTLTYLSGFLFVLGYNAVAAILRGMGDSKHPLLFVIIAAISNLVLDLLFVAVFKWDAFGAALATLLGFAISFVCSIVYLYIKRENFGFDFKLASFKIDGKILKAMVRLGIPLAIQHAAIMVSMLFISARVNSYGDVATSVTGVGNKLRSIMSIISNAISTAGSAMAAQNLGAGKPERVKKIVRTSLLLCVVVATGLSAVYLLFPKEMFSLFTTDAEYLAMAPDYAPVLVLYVFSFAFMSTFNIVINGVGDVPMSYLVGIMDGVVARIGVAILLAVAFNMGIYGYWYGSAGAGFVAALIGCIYYFSGKWKSHRLLID